MNFAKKILQEKKKNEEKLIAHIKKEQEKLKKIKQIQKENKLYKKTNFELNIYCVDEELEKL